jgi:hypothetical protein
MNQDELDLTVDGYHSEARHVKARHIEAGSSGNLNTLFRNILVL